MTGTDYDLEKIHPLGEASRTPDHQLDDHSTASPVDSEARRSIQGILNTTPTTSTNADLMEYRYRHRTLTNLKLIEVAGFDDADRERSGTARTLLQNGGLLSQPKHREEAACHAKS